MGDDETVQLKGRVTCELHSHEVLLTELIFQNVFVDYTPAEIAALLSSVVFQQVKQFFLLPFFYNAKKYVNYHVPSDQSDINICCVCTKLCFVPLESN